VGDADHVAEPSGLGLAPTLNRSVPRQFWFEQKDRVCLKRVCRIKRLAQLLVRNGYSSGCDHAIVKKLSGTDPCPDQ
jgi:hypothetical protein